MKPKKALIVVDLNNDFMPGGALPVEGGDAIIEPINELMASGQYDLVIETQDWHPDGHASFGQWPPHCVAGTLGAELHPQVDHTRADAIFRKGFDPDADSYSGFYNDRGESNGLAEMIQARGVEAVDVVGLATDFCVKHTALDAAKLGLKTRVLLHACRGVNLEPGDLDEALNQMGEAGVVLVEEI